jgi:hypothetical protein
MKKFDIIIIGGGIAGLSSALTAVRYGMQTALIDKNIQFGGIAKDCFHTYICGLFKNNIAKPFEIANPGICSDIFDFLHQRYGDKSLVRMGKVETLAFIQKDLWGYFTEHLNKKNFIFYNQCFCKKIVSKNKKIHKITITTQNASWQNDIDLAADVFIDAAGCAELSEKSRKNSLQLGGYCFLLDGKLKKDLSLIIPYTAHKIVKEYKLDEYLKFITITHNFLTKKYILKFSVKHHADMEKCKFIYDNLNRTIKELSGLKFVKASKGIHLRSCSNTEPEAKTCGKQYDTGCAVKSFWPAETWDKEEGTQYQYCKQDQPFCIPVSALCNDKIDNLFHAGKNIRVSKQIDASARVMGICMATGEQAVINAVKYLKKI